jgi:hypothetical protein
MSNEMVTEILDGLANEYLGQAETQPEPDESYDDEERNEESVPDEEGAEDEGLEGGEEGEDLEEAEGDEVDEAPEGVSKLTLMGKDGKPFDMEIDDLLKDTMHEIVVDGKSEYVSYHDLIGGYQRNKDYTQGKQQMAEQQREMLPYSQLVSYAREDPAFLEYVNNYFQTGGMPQTDPSLQISDEDLAKLVSSDYDEDRAKARQILSGRATLQQKMQERQRVTQQAQAYQQQQFTQWKAHEDARAKELVPDYDDSAATEFLRRIGYSDAELQQGVIDHRQKLIIAAAMRAMGQGTGEHRSNDNGKAAKPTLKSKRKRSIPPRAVRSGTGKQSPSKTTRSQKAAKRAIQTGATQDWADHLFDRLGFDKM